MEKVVVDERAESSASPSRADTYTRVFGTPFLEQRETGYSKSPKDYLSININVVVANDENFLPGGSAIVDVVATPKLTLSQIEELL